jgi:hypothetical protein
MKLIFDLGFDRCAYEGPDEPPPSIGELISTAADEKYPAFHGVVTAVLPTAEGYLVTVSPQKQRRGGRA